MIGRIKGRIIERSENMILMQTGGIAYEIYVPATVLQRLDNIASPEGDFELVTYHYWQLSPSTATPILIGFTNEIERDFFLQFITVSGIGPRAAVKAINKPISDIVRAIDVGDVNYLKTLPGIGAQRAKEIVAKLQGKIGKFGLIRDKVNIQVPAPIKEDWQKEALEVLLQLQYKKQEAVGMIEKAIDNNPEIGSAEELLNEIYKQRTKF
jgi:Holliday junction DNA helicase RuvA